MAAFERLPGTKWVKANWSIWPWLFIQLFTLLQVGGIIGGVAIALHIAFSFLPVPVWVLVAAVSAALLVYKGYYDSVDKLCLVMIGVFTLLPFASLFSLQYTTSALSWQHVASGLSFSLPPAAVGMAIARFGLQIGRAHV